MNPVHIMGFLSQWKMYLDTLSVQPDGTFRGKPLDPTAVEKVDHFLTTTGAFLKFILFT